MDARLLLFITLLTLIACLVFVGYNPNIAVEYDGNITDGETFSSNNHQFDFKAFLMNSSSRSFTANIIMNGHTQLVDDTGNITINYLELDKMFHIKRDRVEQFLGEELKKPSWNVDGVNVHEITFIFHDNLYSAYYKNSTSNTVIYIASPDEQVTADLMNSLEFR